MPSFHFAFVGHKTSDPLFLVLDDYCQRLSHYAKLKTQWLKENPDEIEKNFMARPSGELKIVLDEKGDEWSTAEWTRVLEKWQHQGIKNISFWVGGSSGHSHTMKKQATKIVSLAKITLPHRLAAVVLVEQVYRVHTILRGEPYHRN